MQVKLNTSEVVRKRQIESNKKDADLKGPAVIQANHGEKMERSQKIKWEDKTDQRDLKRSRDWNAIHLGESPSGLLGSLNVVKIEFEKDFFP